MKINHTTSLFAFLVLVFTLVQCEKNDPIDNNNPNDNSDTTSTGLNPYKGNIGFTIDARAIAKKGYKPVRAEVNFTGDFEKFSRDLTLGEDTYFAVLKYEVDSLSAEEIEAFSEGVPIEINVVDTDDKKLGSMEEDDQILDANNATLYLDTDLSELFPEIKLNPETPYLIQSEDSKQVFGLGAIPVIGFPPYPMGVYSRDYDYTSENQKFYFKPVPDQGDSCFYILGNADFAFSGTSGTRIYQTTKKYNVDELTDNNIFVITPDKPGWVKIRLLSASEPLKEHNDETANSSGNFVSDGTADDYTRFRLINADLQWEVTDLGTAYHQPVLPPTKLEFAYKATLSNCSSATLTETIGRSETRTQSFTSGTEESLELFTSHEASVEVTAGVEVESKFFGNGAEYSLEVTAGYSYTTSKTTTSTEYWESTKTTEVEISREREVEIGPYLAVEAYDAVETLSNVKLPFTKKFRIKAIDSNENPIAGDELVFQLFSNMFGGVVTRTGDDFIEISIKGTTVIDKMMEVDTKITELEDACN